MADNLARLLWRNRDNPYDCWLWLGHRKRGYAVIIFDGHQRVLHRFVYEVLVGPVPAGMELDHLCRVRHCVNPVHMEPVTHLENMRRGRGLAALNLEKKRCVRGHPLAGPNLEIDHRGMRQCRICNLIRGRAKRFANRIVLNARSREYQRRLRAEAKALGLTKREHLRQRGVEYVPH